MTLWSVIDAHLVKGTTKEHFREELNQADWTLLTTGCGIFCFPYFARA